MQKNILENLNKSVIISVQAMPNEPLYNEICINAMIKSVITGGAKGLRLAGARDVKNAKKISALPVIAITKPEKIPANYKDVVYITPTIDDAKTLIDAGADIIAFDGTSRRRSYDENLYQLINFIHARGKLAMADISTFEEGGACALLGADIVSTTLSGYTSHSKAIVKDEPDFKLVKKLSETLNIPVILEGRVWEEKHVKKAFKSGAFAIVAGSAVTRPQLITKRFVNAAL
ncbi:MAG: N-acetylmannosamine-6-phosphate 2-epimerase [Candidatus Gastranaerophilales bacterium]|nr:N-acetylmannosamine-6-phosphate 2-epimerase [Candidatus Gastranaerophilales bacterium]